MLPPNWRLRRLQGSAEPVERDWAGAWGSSSCQPSAAIASCHRSNGQPGCSSSTNERDPSRRCQARSQDWLASWASR